MNETGRRPAQALCLAAFFFLVMAFTVAGFLAREWRPPVASRHGEGVDAMITYILVVTGVIYVIGHAALIGLLIRYSGGRPAALPRLGSKAEWRWALIAAFVMAGVSEGGVLVIGLPVWAKMYGAAPADALEVEVVGKQFEWLARYPGKDGKFGRTDPTLVNDAQNPLGLDEKDPAGRDDVIQRGALHLPADRPIVARLRSHDVLHSFSIPAFRVKQDLIPGFVARTQFVPHRIGTYEIACSELCGLGHYRMRGVAYVKDAREFEQWLAAQPGWFE